MNPRRRKECVSKRKEEGELREKTGMASGESASVRHEEYKDSIPPPHIRQELRASDAPEGDRISGIQGGTTFHTGNIAGVHEPQQQQLFHSVPPMKSQSSGNQPSMMNTTLASNKQPSPQEEHTTTN